MGALALALLCALVLGALLWLGLGERFNLSPGERNVWLNILAYVAMVLPFSLLFVAVILPRL